MRLSRWITFPLLMGFLAAVPALIIRNDFWLVELLVRFGIGAGIGFGAQAWSDHRTRQRAGVAYINDEIYSVRQTRSVTIFGDRRHVMDLCEQAVDDLGNARLKNVDRENGEIVAKTRMSLNSFGNLITFRVAEIGDNLAEVTIRTRPALSITAVDYGRGLEIAEKLTQFLKKNEPSVNTSLLRDGADMLAAATKRPLANDFDRRMAGSTD